MIRLVSASRADHATCEAWTHRTIHWWWERTLSIHTRHYMRIPRVLVHHVRSGLEHCPIRRWHFSWHSHAVRDHAVVPRPLSVHPLIGEGHHHVTHAIGVPGHAVESHGLDSLHLWRQLCTTIRPTECHTVDGLTISLHRSFGTGSLHLRGLHVALHLCCASKAVLLIELARTRLAEHYRWDRLETRRMTSDTSIIRSLGWWVFLLLHHASSSGADDGSSRAVICEDRLDKITSIKRHWSHKYLKIVSVRDTHLHLLLAIHARPIDVGSPPQNITKRINVLQCIFSVVLLL